MYKITNKEELLKIDIGFFLEDIPPEEILKWLGLLDAYWQHSGDPKMPHAVLRSGRHSSGFADWMQLLSYPKLCYIVANQLVRKLRANGLEEVHWVIGSAYAAIDFSKDVAALLGARHGFTEKGEGDKMLWKRHTIQKGEIVLQADELITTTGTLIRVREGINEGNAVQPVEYASLVGVLHNRSDQEEFERARIISVVDKKFREWVAGQCELCDEGSEPIKEPKKNWAKLTGKA